LQADTDEADEEDQAGEAHGGRGGALERSLIRLWRGFLPETEQEFSAD
jgi:hypothetical protein